MMQFSSFLPSLSFIVFPCTYIDYFFPGRPPPNSILQNIYPCLKVERMAKDICHLYIFFIYQDCTKRPCASECSWMVSAIRYPTSTITPITKKNNENDFWTFLSYCILSREYCFLLKFHSISKQCHPTYDQKNKEEENKSYYLFLK